ncbi:MAG TPA: 4Fe-4S binding protein [Candidatus Nanopelagicaceae bacterium]|nr:4Fe-4S binding protein [Candidatus Nanopelagicaceae bacterium]
MKKIVIDNILCIKCRDCAEACPENLFFSPPTPIGEKRKVLFIDPNDKCTGCGLCIDVCPTNALELKSKNYANSN